MLVKPISRYVEEAGISVEKLAADCRLDVKTVKAIVEGHFTPTPLQRERLAAALGVAISDISWDHSVPVEHLRGNGPQCGRST